MRRSFLVLWGPFLAALAILFWLSSMSSVPGGEVVWDKLLHTVGYTGLGLLAMRAFHGGFARPRGRPTMYAALTVILWAISDEIHQSFVPGRDASALDVMADAVGFALSVLLLLAASRTGIPVEDTR